MTFAQGEKFVRKPELENPVFVGLARDDEMRLKASPCTLTASDAGNGDFNESLNV